MQFSKGELGAAWSSLTAKNDAQKGLVPRVFGLGDLKCAGKAGAKLKEVSVDDKFVDDSEIEFNTDEKALILRCLREREWSALDAEHVLSLEEKLNG